MTRIREDARLIRQPLRPRRRLGATSAAAENWNRIGGLLTRAGRILEIPRHAMLAVWMVECGALPFQRGRPVLRFEAHVFFARWGSRHEALFDAHFRFGGRHGAEGAKWQNHMLRETPGGDWRRFHGDQHTEYLALALATGLAGPETACQCASFGGPQIMGFNHELAGHESAHAMFRAFARSERWQVLAFLDFCAARTLFPALRAGDWLAFASVYNGPGNAEAYAARIAAACRDAGELLNGGLEAAANS
ncbi:MAG: N-acetylmuramidase domain-containing protein [Aestuariivirga sp.]|uniref:N-acetylmuramidase domain-containing protein n=1 Tax=Aestuariivirga sp. TaxID=2650926 RepID=UPI0038D183FD